MLYKCLKCEHEVAAGCLPTASFGCYLFALMALLPLLLIGTALLVRVFVPLPPPQPVEAPPWWAWVVSMVATPVLMVGSGWGFHFLLSSIEHFLVRCAKCPQCGSRKWSKGFTRGFGL